MIARANRLNCSQQRGYDPRIRVQNPKLFFFPLIHFYSFLSFRREDAFNSLNRAALSFFRHSGVKLHGRCGVFMA